MRDTQDRDRQAAVDEAEVAVTAKKIAKKTAKKTTKAVERPTTCKECSLLRGGPDNHKCACDWRKMTTAERKADRAEQKRLSDERQVEMKRVDLQLDLSPSNAQELLTSLKPWLKEFHSGFMQLKLSARDVQSIYICLVPQQLKKLVARLAEIARRPSVKRRPR